MIVYLIRHGTASHLLEDFNKKVNQSDFLKLLEEWNKATLTPLGKEEISGLVNALNNKFHFIYYSPLKRTEETAKAFLNNPQNDNILYKVLPQLSEIFISPPRLPHSVKLKLKHWVFLCVLKSIFTLRIIKYYYQARQIIHRVKKVNQDILIISHQARIFTIIVYAFLSPAWKIVKTDFNPAGVSIIKKRNAHDKGLS